MKYTVWEYPWKCCSFETLAEAIVFIQKHKPGMQDCCWVEDDTGTVVWRGQ